LRERIERADIVVVGAGLFGLTIAQQVAERSSCHVVVVEQRSHMGGNSYSYDDDDTGIEVHPYGTHVFHTDSEKIWNYIQRFGKFNDYRHRVRTVANGRVFGLPINLGTICAFFDRVLTPNEARALLASQGATANGREGENLEQRAISLVGRPLYDALIRGYTTKQWGDDPKNLPAETIGRLPVRYSFNDEYFSDAYQGLPVAGYDTLTRTMAAHPQIDVALATDFHQIEHLVPKAKPIVYSAPIDRYFGYRCGRLAWRTIDLDIQNREVADAQGTAVLNFADPNVPWTRIHEFRHLHPERRPTTDRTIIAYEYSRPASTVSEAYYPVNSPTDRTTIRAYRDLAHTKECVIFGGRLGSYRYLDMHMAIASALQVADNVVLPTLIHRRPFQGRIV
jgi:UDP-galactopyranose mutase